MSEAISTTKYVREKKSTAIFQIPPPTVKISLGYRWAIDISIAEARDLYVQLDAALDEYGKWEKLNGNNSRAS